MSSSVVKVTFWSCSPHWYFKPLIDKRQKEIKWYLHCQALSATAVITVGLYRNFCLLWYSFKQTTTQIEKKGHSCQRN
jgi:hypothetical protein